MMHITWRILIEKGPSDVPEIGPGELIRQKYSDENKPGIIGLSGFELKPMTGPVKIELFKNGIPDIA